MATLTSLDTVENSQIDLGISLYRVTRGGFVTGLTGASNTALEQIVDAVAAAGHALGSSLIVGGKVVVLRRIVGSGIQGDTARVQLLYDNDLVGTNSAYTITYGGYLQAYQTNRIPGSRIPILVPAWQDPIDIIAGGSNIIPSDLATATFEYPMRQVTISGIKQGILPDPGKYDGYVGYANSDTFLSKDPGYWKLTNGGSTISKYGGYYEYHLSAVTKNIEDWSAFFTLYNAKARLYVKVAEVDETAVKAAPYAYGIIASAPGLVRIGPYPVTPFGALFGLGQSIGAFNLTDGGGVSSNT